MSRQRRARQQKKHVSEQAQAVAAAQPAIPGVKWWLALAFLLPNLGALACGFVFDDMPVIVQNEGLHPRSLRQFLHIFASGYWPDRRGLQLYRPVTQAIWALTWTAGGGSHPAIFHALGLGLGLAVVLLLYSFFLEVRTPPRTAFIASALFALFPIHTEATTSVVGSAELLAAAFGLGALILYYRRRPVWAVLLLALAVFSKESAAAFAAVPLIFPPKEWRSRESWIAAAGGAMVLAAALVAHHIVAVGAFIPAIDNPMGLVGTGPRIFTALWIQCLYLFKTVVPITLSADYSYKEIRLVMGLQDVRAWAGLALAIAALILAWRNRQFRAPVLAYAILFSATSNVLFPIGTIMGERLAYVPSLALALLLAILLARSRYWKEGLIVVALVFGTRTVVRNLDWLNADRFYTKLVKTSPNSAKVYYFYGILRAARGDDLGAIQAYDHAIAIFPAYSEAFHNRGNSLARLGRRDEAMASYRQCLRFDPGHAGAAANLMQLQAGLPLNPPRQHL
ncbi:MAG TPA: tetratricopeptide repeat protein [Terriglobales bacterium]|nr:tetratricopeptide repeat protein [Terriglobales bacterium]